MPFGSTLENPEVPRRGLRILLVDDNEVIQSVVEGIAEKLGHQVIPALTGAAALEAAITAQPDIIVLDMGLPDADGRDVLNRLKADKRTAQIPVVIWSGRKGESDSRISLNLGAEDYVEKGDALLLIRKLERMSLRLDESA
jgi:two-component system, OmpR family, KDP operon response regulator KdpE